MIRRFVDLRSPREVYVYKGEFSSYLGRIHGAVETKAAAQFVVFSHNTTRRATGPLDRLASLWDTTAKVAATAVLMSPFIPLLFMGEEYVETPRSCIS